MLRRLSLALAFAAPFLLTHPAFSQQKTARKPEVKHANLAPTFSGAKALEYTREVVAFGPRYLDSPGHAKVEQFLKAKLAHDDLSVDEFTTQTPAGAKQMRNYIVKFPGNKDGIILITGHYDTLYNRRDFVGANDGGSSTGILLALADYYRAQTTGGKKLDGYSVWLAFLDGEEAIREWTDADSIYGSKHLAQKYQQDGTAKKIKAFILEDMIGDKDLDLEDDSNSTPALKKLVMQAAEQHATQSHVFQHKNTVGDDHTPWAAMGIPVVDLIDFDYGYNNAFWHSREDTMDKLSANSFQIVGDITVTTVKLISEHNGVQ